MPIEYRDGVTGSDVNGALALTIPPSVQAGDLLLITWHVASDLTPIDLPSGWAYVPETTPGTHTVGSSRTAAIYKVATSGDAGSSVSLAVTAGAPVKQSAALTAWSGCDQTTPIHTVTFAGASGLSGTTHPVPTVTTTIADCVIVASAHFKDSSVTAITAPPGYTSRGSVTMTGGGRSSSAQASKAAATAGSYGGESWTTDATPSSRGMWTIALAPVATTQTVRPASDVTVTDVTDQAGSTTAIYQAIDEVTLNLADYAKFVQGGVYETKLAAAAAPPSGPVTVDYVLGLADGAGTSTWTVKLMQGTTEIASWTDIVTADNTPVSHALTAEQFSAITDWGDLRIRWTLTTVGA